MCPQRKDVKATGGSGSKKHVDLIWKIPSLWCQRFLRNVKILLRSEVISVSMCWPFDFSIVILGVIFDTFYTSFGYRSWDVGTGTSKFCKTGYFNGLFWMKNSDLEILCFGWFWTIWAQNSVFLQKIRFKGYTGKLIPSARNELQSWKLADGCGKVFQKTYKRRNFDLSYYFLKKILSKKIKFDP